MLAHVSGDSYFLQGTHDPALPCCYIAASKADKPTKLPAGVTKAAQLKALAGELKVVFPGRIPAGNDTRGASCALDTPAHMLTTPAQP